MAVSGPVPVGEWEALTGTDSGPTFCLSARSRVHPPEARELMGVEKGPSPRAETGCKTTPHDGGILLCVGLC